MAEKARFSALPTATVPDPFLLTAGALVTVRVNAWVMLPDMFLAVKAPSGKIPAAEPDGVPEMVPVPSPFLVKVTPAGSRPDLATVGTGEPDVITAKLKASPKLTVSDAALVKASPSPTVLPADIALTGELPANAACSISGVSAPNPAIAVIRSISAA